MEIINKNDINATLFLGYWIQFLCKYSFIYVYKELFSSNDLVEGPPINPNKSKHMTKTNLNREYLKKVLTDASYIPDEDITTTLFLSLELGKPILVEGPPGTGKTLLAKAVAHETHATFIKIVASEFVRKYIGEGARIVRGVFELAKEKSPSIIFIDEIDAVAAKRLKSSTSGDREVQRTLMQLLAELDGFESRGDVGIVAATNRPDILDPALLRPGRFDRFIEVPLPNEEGRKEILKIHTANMSLADDVDINLIARMTDGASGADLKAICTEAGMFAIREEREEVTMNDFLNAVDKITGIEKEEDFRREAGVMFG